MKEPVVEQSFYHRGSKAWCVVTRIDRSVTGVLEKVHYRLKDPRGSVMSGKDWEQNTFAAIMPSSKSKWWVINLLRKWLNLRG